MPTDADACTCPGEQMLADADACRCVGAHMLADADAYRCLGAQMLTDADAYKCLGVQTLAKRAQTRADVKCLEEPAWDYHSFAIQIRVEMN